MHARVNRELNLTSLVSPQEKLPPSCDTMVLEQGRFWLAAVNHFGCTAFLFEVGVCVCVSGCGEVVGHCEGAMTG